MHQIAWLALILVAIVAQGAQYDYGIMIDAGSTGSRVYVFEWAHRQSANVDWVPPLSEPTRQVDWTKKIGPGLSSFGSNLDGVAGYLQTLVDFAKKIMVGLESRFATTPIFLGATAGMRVLPNPQRNQVMAKVRDFFLDKTKNPFSYKPSYSRIISGEEEGVYGWITANYLLKSLGVADPTRLYGALDLGGASTQITYAPSGEILSEYFPVNLPAKSYQLYTHSFLYFGIVEATRRVKEWVVKHGAQGTGGPTSRVNPCYPADYSQFRVENFTASDGTWATLEGSGNFAQCRQAALALFDHDTPCWADTCSFNGVYQTPLQPAPTTNPSNTTFLAFSSFAQTANGMKIPTDATLATWWSTTQAICNLGFQALNNTYNPTYATTYCFTGHFVIGLLHDNYGFSLDDTNINWNLNVGTEEVSWALGGMYYQANALPWQLPNPSSCTGQFTDGQVMAIFLGFSSVVTVLACGLFYLRWTNKRLLNAQRTNDGYVDLGTMPSSR